MDWTEDCKYMCMNAFAVKWDADAKTFSDYRTLEIQQNGAYYEFYGKK